GRPARRDPDAGATAARRRRAGGLHRHGEGARAPVQDRVASAARRGIRTGTEMTFPPGTGVAAVLAAAIERSGPPPARPAVLAARSAGALRAPMSRGIGHGSAISISRSSTMRVLITG